jgi:hypothetical protein
MTGGREIWEHGNREAGEDCSETGKDLNGVENKFL